MNLLKSPVRLLIPCAALVLSTASAATFHLAGDSTLDDGGRRPDHFPYASWGVELEKSMLTGNCVRCCARSGASTKSFRREGNWSRLIAEVRPGDFVGIQFGHNDQKRRTPRQLETKWADPQGLFKEIVRAWVAEVRAKGASPLLMSPICRGTFDAEGRRLVDTTHATPGVTLASYRDAMRELSAELGCDYVDMNTLTHDFLEKLGRAGSDRMFVVSSGVVRGKDGEPSTDVTHPVQAGAEAFARLFLDDVRRRHLAVAKLFRKRPTEIMFWFDTENYTEEFAAEPIKDIANLLTEEGVRGHFCIVGYEAKKLVDWRRTDILDALKPHVIGSQTLYHTWHPNITESTDLEDFDAAYLRAAREEYESLGMIKAATGRERLLCSVLPGNGNSIAALYLYADMGIPFFGGGCGVYNDGRHAEVWYCNQRHRSYCPWMHLEDFLPGKEPVDVEKRLDEMAEHEGLTLYMHPHMAVVTCHPDGLNWNKGNQTPFGKWIPCPHRDPADTKVYYERLRAFVRRIKADPRFEITDCEKLLAAQKPRRAITRADLPAIRDALKGDFGPVSQPGSWCVADCFRAVVEMLRGADSYLPGKAYGFLYAPEGVTRETAVSRADVVVAARKMDVTRFLPHRIAVGDAVIGPADYLFAALAFLTTEAESVTLHPREQLGDIAAKLPTLATFRCAGTWRYMPDFRDEWISNRLRWQFWTLRYE